MIQQIIRRQILFFVADEGDVFYNPSFSYKKQNARLEKDETRAKFLVDLLENQGYEMRDIQLDFESPKVEIFGSVDLVALKNEKPFLIAQFLRNKPSLAEIAFAKEALFEKARDIEAVYAILAWDKNKEVFLSTNSKFKKIKI